MRSVFRSGFGQNSVARLTTRELGKHSAVSKYPQKPLFCTHTVIYGLKIWKSEQHDELGNVSHSLNWVDVIMVLARGCRGQRMRSGCTKSWLWPMDALRDG